MVPNEKKSADSAILPAVRQARGSSIIVPIITLWPGPTCSPFSRAILRAEFRTRSSSW